MALTTVRPQGMGFNTGRRNLIINGAMQVAQRGTSKTSTTDGYHTVDRWNTDIGTAFDQLALTTAQDTNAPDGFSNSFKLTVATAETAVASDELLRIWQIVEAQNAQHLGYGTSGAKKTTLSFYVKGSVTGTYGLALYQGDGSRINGATYTINSANTWERKIITFDGDASGTINNDNGAGLYIWWVLAAGSDYTGTANTGWQTYAAGKLADGHTANDFVTTSSATWQITGVQLEVGENASDFEHRSFGEELALCQRYYFRTTGSSTGFGNLAILSRIGDTLYRGVVEFPVTMRSRPSFSNSGSFQTLDSGFTFSSMSGGDGASFDSHGVQVTMTTDGSAGQSTLLRQAADGQAALIYDAEL